MFRGDEHSPSVKEYICGPLPELLNCDALQLTNGRESLLNFAIRHSNKIELDIAKAVVLPKVDEKVGNLRTV
ncbi:amine oxidase [Elysia marginata]|uniref:Amine oxidase n=1 Tax=Elysia marginata TaxID=1093978 RepID=A0AAV4HR31_9GAST|nr:amine oxidase [Elysia marginata]